jgi:hypothetical protein
VQGLMADLISNLLLESAMFVQILEGDKTILVTIPILFRQNPVGLRLVREPMVQWLL